MNLDKHPTPIWDYSTPFENGKIAKRRLAPQRGWRPVVWVFVFTFVIGLTRGAGMSGLSMPDLLEWLIGLGSLAGIIWVAVDYHRTQKSLRS